MNNRYLIMLLIISTFAFYCATSVSRRLSILQITYKPFLILFFIGFCVLSLGPIFDWIIPRSYPNISISNQLDSFLVEAGWLVFGVYSCVVVLVILADLIELLTLPITLYFKLIKHNITTYKTIYNFVSLLSITVISTSVLIIGRYNAKSPTVYPIEIKINNLPLAFDGYKIAQISDLHVSPMITEKNVNYVVEMTNKLNPDMIALTGDLVDGSVEKRIKDISSLSKLSAPDGVFFVSGNHEYYSGINEWLDFFPSLNFKILSNSHVVLHKTRMLLGEEIDDKLIIAGVPDYGVIKRRNPSFSASDILKIDIDKTFAGSPENVPRILLAHTPETYNLTKNSKIDLQLSGHTHSGQYFPYTFFIKYFQKYYVGLYNLENDNQPNTQLYINKGTAFWGPPLRTWSKPEITLITLRKAS